MDQKDAKNSPLPFAPKDPSASPETSGEGTNSEQVIDLSQGEGPNPGPNSIRHGREP